MTARHIISRWERVRRTMNSHHETWLRLLYVANAGEKGIKLTELSALVGHASTNSLSNNLRPHANAGLITIERVPCPRGGFASSIYRITDKGLDYLGLKPVKEDAA